MPQPDAVQGVATGKSPDATKASHSKGYRISVVSLGARVAIQFLGSLLLARTLGPVAFGEGSAIIAAGAVAFIIVGAGFNASLVVRANVERGFLRSTLSLNSLLALA